MENNHHSGHRFIGQAEKITEAAERGAIDWFSKPELTGSEGLLIARVTMEPGQIHGFHFHPRREEAIYVLEGKLEQWIEDESKVLAAGDAAHIPAEVVHATFTLDVPVTFLAILSPASFDDGEVEFMTDVSTREPWAGLHASRSAREEQA
jgi:quercetin dioxygenase-like cupin family protein